MESKITPKHLDHRVGKNGYANYLHGKHLDHVRRDIIYVTRHTFGAPIHLCLATLLCKTKQVCGSPNTCILPGDLKMYMNGADFNHYHHIMRLHQMPGSGDLSVFPFL